MQTENRTIKVGSFTLALGLIALGAGILAGNLGLLEIPKLLRFWPLLLVGLGLEYFIRKLFSRGGEVQFSIPGTILIALIAAAAAAASALYGIIPGFISGADFFRGNSEYVSQWQGEPVALEKGARLEIQNGMGEVEILPSTDSSLHLSARITGRGVSVEAARAASEAQRIEVQSGPVTRVYVPDQHTSVKLTVEVPEGLSISASNKMGNLTARGVTAGALALESDMGRVEAEDCVAGIRAGNRLGEINLKNIRGDIAAETSMGRITVTNPGGNVTARGRNGSILLASDRPLDRTYAIQADNGQITMRLPRSSSLRLQASSDHGSISGMESPGGQGVGPGRSQGALTLGGGAGSAQLETRNGSIRVEVTG